MKTPTRLIDENTFKLIAEDWMLITAGNKDSLNTMTASFGGFGVLFFKDVAHIYVRPERHTFSFLEENETFSLTFFNEEYKDKLAYCGKVSGRNENKIEKCGFETVYYNNETPYFKQAKLTLICKKIYAQDIKEDCFIDKEAYVKTYSNGGMHRMYIGEIIDVIK